ncbi:MAG: PAS domain-containing protein [Chloroflexi bacterium]|nr:PAS domain-containing protein [Chloroflexota bacterium]MBI3168055.1 PAS domain-containing protein [Chloroflexota bacterium]
MIKFLDRILNVDVDDPEDFRRRRLLNTMLLGALIILILNIVSLFLSPATLKEESTPLFLMGMAIFFIGVIGIYYVNRRSGKWAAFLFLLVLTLVVNLTDAPDQLANGRSTFVYTIPIAISSLILFPSASFIFSIVSAICIVLLATSSDIPVVPNFFAIIGFFMLALVSWLTTRSLDQALKELRATNLNLDHLVEQKTRELAATLSRELVVAGRNQAILNSIADGVIVFDEHNIAILANPALSRLTEIPLENLVNRSVVDFILNQSLSSSRQSLQALFENPEETATGIRVNWASKTLSASIARVQDAHDKSIGTVAVFRDITREVELERMKDTFMGVVSHELRTPLNAILGYAEMLKEGVYGAINDKQSGIAQRVMNSTQRLLTIVSDLLDQAQIQSGKLKIRTVSCKPAELLEALRGVMDRIALDKGIELKTELDPAMPPVIMGDPQRLQQVMINLVNNAIKFTENGNVSMRILRLDAKNWQIRTTDTGGGIPADAQEYIFETFRQVEGGAIRQHGGVGLGLSIVKQLVELMHGKIAVESEIGKGSTFTVTLPIMINDDSQPTITDPRQEKL